MNKINFLLILLVSIFLTSCQKDSDPVIIYDIQDEFDIEIFQDLNSSNNFFLEITTLDDFPDNYHIEADVMTIDNKIELNIYRILKSSNPSNHTKKISKKINLNNLAIGNYSLDLIIRNSVVNGGAISIKPATIELDFSTKHGITAKHYEVNRIAPNGYWGVAYVESENHSIFLNGFIHKLKNSSTEFLDPKIGSYGYFTINNQNKIILPLSSPQGAVFKTFYMASDEFDTINNHIQEYKSYGIGFHAMVYTAQGQVFHHVSYDPPSPSIAQSQSKGE